MCIELLNGYSKDRALAAIKGVEQNDKIIF